MGFFTKKPKVIPKVEKKESNKVDHLRIRDYSKSQVYTPVSERKSIEDVRTSVVHKVEDVRAIRTAVHNKVHDVVSELPCKKVLEEKQVDMYKIVGFINPFGKVPDFVYLVYEFKGRLYIENHDNEGLVEGFLMLNKQECEMLVRFDEVKVYNEVYLDDSYVGKEATDVFLVDDSRIYVDRVNGFRKLIGVRYRLANASVAAKVLVKR